MQDIRSVSVMVTVASDCAITAREIFVDVSCTVKVSSCSGIWSSKVMMAVHCGARPAVKVRSVETVTKSMSLLAARSIQSTSLTLTSLVSPVSLLSVVVMNWTCG